MTNALATVNTDIDIDSTTDIARLCDEALAMMQQFDRALYQASIEMGLKLLEVKARLPHGAFLPWLEAANWESRTANRLMTVAKELGPKSDTLTHIPRTMLYTIARLPADRRDDVLILITDPAHPPLNEIKTRVKEITDAVAVASRDRMAERDQKRASPSQLALTRRANAAAKVKDELEARTKRKERLASKLAEMLNLLPDHMKNEIAMASHDMTTSEIKSAYGDAFDLMNQPATVEPMPIPKQLDDSDEPAVEIPELIAPAA
jgi:hypothetical protein